MGKGPLKTLTHAGFSLLNGLLNRVGFRVERFDQWSVFEALLYRRLQRSPDFFFVQVGANDGVSSDPIHAFVTRNRVRGLALEPLPDVFAKLQETYAGYPGVIPVNLALHSSAKSVDLHRVDPAKGAHLGGWTQGIGSVRPDHHRLSGTPSDLMVKVTVPCLTLSELLARYDVERYDLLQVDTEGYDFEIIKMVDFTRHRPAIIRFEHGLPDEVMTRADFKECALLLMEAGYHLITEPYDAIAYDPKEV